MGSQRSSGHRSSPDHSVRRRRDDALERTRSITRTIGVASVAAVAAFGIYLSRALPGHAATSSGSSGSAGSAVSPSGGSASTGGNSSSSPSPTTLAPPNSPPVQSQQQAPVVSGSS
jgi:hypothetical protein